MPLGIASSVIAATIGVAMVVGLSASSPRLDATRVVRFVPASTVPARVVDGRCADPSDAAWPRSDAFRCSAAGQTYDPCFVAAGSDRSVGSDRLICPIDPRDASRAVGVTVNRAIDLAPAAAGVDGGVWFFELTDGSSCQAMTLTREIEGIPERYSCHFAMAGTLDAVLGDLDMSTPIWTVQEVLLNKKVEPQTIKSSVIAAVKTAWR